MPMMAFSTMKPTMNAEIAGSTNAPHPALSPEGRGFHNESLDPSVSPSPPRGGEGRVRGWIHSASTVDLAEDGVDRTHDGDDVGDLVARDDVWQEGQVRERGTAPLHAVRLGRAVGDQVAADLAARALDAGVRLALGDAHLPHRLHARAGRDGPRGQPVESLADDLDGLAELDHPHAVAREAVPRPLHRHLEVEVLVRRIR